MGSALLICSEVSSLLFGKRDTLESFSLGRDFYPNPPGNSGLEYKFAESPYLGYINDKHLVVFGQNIYEKFVLI